MFFSKPTQVKFLRKKNIPLRPKPVENMWFEVEHALF
jgi:hypothetical protein